MGSRRPADIALGTLGATTLTIALAAGGTLGNALLHTGGSPHPGLAPGAQAIVLPQDEPAARSTHATTPAHRIHARVSRPAPARHRSAVKAAHPRPKPAAHRRTRSATSREATSRAGHDSALRRPGAAAKLPARTQAPASAAPSTPAAPATLGFARLRVDDLKVQPTGNGTSRLHLRLSVEDVPAATTTAATTAELPRTVDVHLRVPSPPPGKAMQVGVALVPPAANDPDATPGLHVQVALVDATTTAPAVTDVPAGAPDRSNTLQIVTPVATHLDGAPALAPPAQAVPQPAAPLADAVLPLDGPVTAVQTVSLDAPAPQTQP